MAARLGEFRLIGEVFGPLAAGARGALGLVDDAALIAPGAGVELVVTKDAMVEGRHFLPSDPPDSVGAKLAAVNFSDLAAKGAKARWAFLGLARPDGRGDQWVRGFAAGLKRVFEAEGVALLGGDTAGTWGPAVLSLTAIGEVPPGAMITRAGARPGDQIWVTGVIGEGVLGLRAATGRLGAEIGEAERARLLARYREPNPPLVFGPRLIGLASAAMDVSDGLVGDLEKLAAASGLGATLDATAIPVTPAARGPLFQTAITGGDDYQILFTAPPAQAPAIARASAESGVAATPIGVMSEGQGVRVLDASGAPLALARTSWRHD